MLIVNISGNNFAKESEAIRAQIPTMTTLVVIKWLSSDNTPEEIKNELQVVLGFAPSQVIQMKEKSNFWLLPILST